MKRLSSIFILFILLILPLNATIPTQQRIRLTDSWEYLKGDLGSIWEAVRPAAPGSSEAVPIWQQVTLPHCFNAEDAVDRISIIIRAQDGIARSFLSRIHISMDASYWSLREQDKKRKCMSIRIK